MEMKNPLEILIDLFKVPSLPPIRTTDSNVICFSPHIHNTMVDEKKYLYGMVERKVDREQGDLGLSAGFAIG